MSLVDARYKSSPDGSIVVTIEYQDGNQNRTLHLPLTPPAVHQLARSLKEAVKDYLTSSGPEPG